MILVIQLSPVLTLSKHSLKNLLNYILKLEVPFKHSANENAYVLDKGRKMSILMNSKEDFNEWLHAFRKVKIQQQMEALVPLPPSSVKSANEIPSGMSGLYCPLFFIVQGFYMFKLLYVA